MKFWPCLFGLRCGGKCMDGAFTCSACGWRDVYRRSDSRPPRLISPEAAVMFLNEAARYFEKRPTRGEDMAHWSNVYNADNCRRIAKLIEDLASA